MFANLCQDRDSFQYIVHSAGQQNRELYDQFMSRVGVLASLTKHQRSKIADVLKVLYVVWVFVCVCVCVFICVCVCVCVFVCVCVCVCV